MRCSICIQFPDIVKRFANGKIPEFASAEGARYRSKVIGNHFIQGYHKESMRAHRIKVLARSTPTSTYAPMDFALNKAYEKQADHVGKLLIHIFNDAKRLTLSAWNWPARYVTAEAVLSLQYVNPKAHLELMHCGIGY